MKTAAALVISVILVIFVSGCKDQTGRQAPKPKPDRPQELEAPQRVRPAVSQGPSVMPLFNSISENLDRLSREAELLKRKPGLNRDKSYNFDTSGAPTLGSEDASIKVVGFTDFECPACAKFASTMEKIVKENPDKVSLTIMNFPLNKDCNPMMSTRMHPRACFMAELAMAAKEQGKYWVTHDYIYQYPSRVRSSNIKEFAERHGMDGDQLLRAVSRERHKQKIRDQARQLLRTGKRGTPAVFINGMEVIKPAWHDFEKTESFIMELISPPEDPELLQAIKESRSLPQATVILDDGTRLEDRLRRIEEKLQNLSLTRESRSESRNIKSMPRDPDRRYPFHTRDRPHLGPQDAPVTVVAFLDLLSAHTEMMVPVLKEVHRKHPKKVKIVFKFMPRARRKVAGDVHVGALEAWRQDKFWEVLDKILENRRDLTEEGLNRIMEQAGLDMQAYHRAMEDTESKQPLVKDFRDAQHARVKRTPAIFVDGKFLPEVNKNAILKKLEEKIKGDRKKDE